MQFLLMCSGYYLYMGQKPNIQKNSQEIATPNPNKNSIDPLQCEGF